MKKQDLGLRSIDRLAKKYFDPAVTDRERAIFEAAIALSAIRHQFIGVPLNSSGKVIEAVKRAIEQTIKLQPHKTSIDVKINKEQIEKEAKQNPYGYTALKGEHLDVEVKAKYGRVETTAKMKYIPELRYNLMYISKINLKK